MFNRNKTFFPIPRRYLPSGFAKVVSYCMDLHSQSKRSFLRT
jgi:hypothetical protein